MPTDLVALLARKKQAGIQAQNDAKVILASYFVCLLVVASLCAFDSVAKAMVLMGAY